MSAGSVSSNDLTNTAALAAKLIAEDKRPTEVEERRIREAIPRLREDVQKLQMQFNEIDISLAIIPPGVTPDVRLTEQFAQLSLQLNNAKDNLANHHNSITYGRQMPVEVLEIVFGLCLPQTDYILPDPLQAPLLLCQICSSWRRVALVSPLLWCSLSLNMHRNRGRWKEFLESWLGRSGSVPISLCLEGDAPTQYFNDHIAKIFLKESHRWKRLRLDVLPAAVTKLLNTSMPMLETLEIRGSAFISSADAPRLRTVFLLGDQTSPDSIHIQWDRIQQFHSAKHALALDRCFLFLAKCKNLTRCTIQLSLATMIQASEHLLPLRMTRLRDLVLIGAVVHDAVTLFFTKIELPSLANLELVNLSENPASLGPQSSLASLARRSNLRSLRLTGFLPPSLEGLFDLVVAIPSLREVILAREGGQLQMLPPVVQEALDMRRSEAALGAKSKGTL
ncbi:hypothetical protein C8R44DRAFT_132692 [Mycena epipterygia]|nr:hypothetical protein C8R44DRAFT_132692 [Mycena epipterygia]